MRLLIAAALVLASWHPVAAQVVAGVANSAGRSSPAPVPITAGTGFSALGGPVSAEPSLSVPRASLSGLGLSAPAIQAGRDATGAAVGSPAAAPAAQLVPALASPAVPSLPSLPALPSFSLPEAPGVSPSAAVPQARGSLLERAAVVAASLQAEPAGSDAGSAGAAKASEKLSRVYDGLQGAEARPSDAVSPTDAVSLQVAGLSAAGTAGRLGLLPASKDARSRARRSLVATGVFKVGMEALGVSMPLIALTYFGSAVWLANMAVTWGLSMTVSSMLSGGWMDRKPVHKVMAKAMLVQAGAVAAILGLFLAGVGSPALVLPLYALAGASMGVVVTGRNLLPARLLGNDHAGLGKFNSVMHLVYEIAGTIAPLLTGLLIGKLGLVAALVLHPPAFLLSAWLFSRMNLDAPAPAATGEPGAGPARGLGALVRNALSDVRDGSRVMLKDSRFRWLTFILLGPMVVHRIFEQILVPFFAKTVLASPGSSAWIVSGSNFGELLGAVLLIKAMTSSQGAPASPRRWIRPMALGTLAVWALVFTGNLYLLIPFVVAMSLTWAANDINLTSYLQSRLPEESAGKAMGFLMAAELACILGLSYGLGFLLDLLPGLWALSIVSAAATLLALLLWKARGKVV